MHFHTNLFLFFHLMNTSLFSILELLVYLFIYSYTSLSIYLFIYFIYLFILLLSCFSLHESCNISQVEKPKKGKKVPEEPSIDWGSRMADMKRYVRAF